jgi:hypothetical protein
MEKAMAFDITLARNFVKSLDLTGTPRAIISQEAATETGEVFDKAKNQAQVVGSGLFSFAQGVTPEVREAISDSALLAQLVANKCASSEEEPLKWFKAYADVLQNVGWTLQEGGWSDYTAAGTTAEVHEKVMEVLAIALGPAPAAVAIINASLNALKAMNPNSSWITIFSRESQKARIARFQVGLVEKEEAGDVLVSMLACLIQATKGITQVLFFKVKKDEASFRANGAKVSVNRHAITDIGPTIRTKIRAYQSDYLSTIVNL